jgi:hypothetical protein
LSGRSAIAVLALAGAGCGPALLWYGHDPARTTRFELLGARGHAWLQAGPRQRSPRYDEVVVADMVWDAGGRHFAVPVRSGTTWHMLVDFVEGPAWDGITRSRFSDDGRRLVYAAERGGRWQIVRDDGPDRAVDAIVDDTLAFSPDGRRLGYAALDAGCVRLYLDGAPPSACLSGLRALYVSDVPATDAWVVDEGGVPTLVRDGRRVPLPGLASLRFDAATGRWAAVLHTGGRARLLVESGGAVDEADAIADVRFSPAGELAYAARDGQWWRFVVGEHREGPYGWLRPAVFSAGGAHHAYVAGRSDGRAAVVVVDGEPRAAAASAEGVVLSPDGRRVAFAVREPTGAGVAIGDAGAGGCRTFPFDLVVETSISFSADGRHWAALVGDRRAHRLSITVDGAGSLPFDSEELFGATAEHAADAAGLRGWVVAEMEKHINRGRP